MPTLENDFRFYLENQEELAQQYEGKYIVIKNRQVLGAYADEESAVKETVKEHELGTFIVQECSSDPESTVVIYSSRVHFG